MEKNNLLTSEMDVLTAIKTRRSIRTFTDQDVADQVVEELLRCAMHAPSAGGAAPWDFVVIRDHELLVKIAEINPYAKFGVNAPLAILICGNLEREKYQGYWVEDTAAAMENLLLAAHGLGLGACWTGIYPDKGRVASFTELLKLPANIIPMGLAIIGYPKHIPETPDRFDASRVHLNIWGQMA